MKTRARVWFWKDGQRVSMIVDSAHWEEPNSAVWVELGKPSTPYIYHYEEVTMHTHKPRSGRFTVKAQFKPELGITATLQIRGQE